MSLQRRPIIAVMAAEELHELNDELGPVVERRGFQQCLFRSGIEWRDLSDAIDQRLIIELGDRVPIDGIALRLREAAGFLFQRRPLSPR